MAHTQRGGTGGQEHVPAGAAETGIRYRPMNTHTSETFATAESSSSSGE